MAASKRIVVLGMDLATPGPRFLMDLTRKLQVGSRVCRSLIYQIVRNIVIVVFEDLASVLQ